MRPDRKIETNALDMAGDAYMASHMDAEKHFLLLSSVASAALSAK